MTDLKQKLLRELNSFNFEDPNILAYARELIFILVQQREALEFECGNTCAAQNSCNAREALAATEEALKKLGIE